MQVRRRVELWSNLGALTCCRCAINSVKHVILPRRMRLSPSDHRDVPLSLPQHPLPPFTVIMSKEVFLDYSLSELSGQNNQRPSMSHPQLQVGMGSRMATVSFLLVLVLLLTQFTGTVSAVYKP